METEEKLMTVPELANYLQVAEKTVLRMIQKKEIPGVKIGNQWRFSRTMIDDWILSRMQVVPKNDLARLLTQSQDLVPLSRFIRKEHILMNIVPGDKSSVLKQLAAPLVRDHLIPDGPAFLERLLDREKLATTAAGEIAFPHARNPRQNGAETPCVVVGICREGTDFSEKTGSPTRLFMLPVTDSDVVHLRLMAKMAELLRREGTVAALLACASEDEVMGKLIGLEQQAT